MKRIIAVLTLLLSTLVLYACTNAETLIIYNWGEYLEPEVVKNFTKETGIKVIEITFDSSQIAETSMRTNNRYDIAFTTEFTVDKIRKEKIGGKPMLQKIDRSRLDFDESIYSDGLKNLVETFKETLGYNIFDYAIPYTVGTFGMLYNADKISEEEVEQKEWDIIKEYKKGINYAIYDSGVELLATAIMAQGHTVKDISEKSLNEALDWLNEIDMKNRNFITDGVFDEVPGGHCDLVFALSGDAVTIISRGFEDTSFNMNLKYYIPENKGTNVWFDNIVIPRTSNTDLAYKFINYLYKKEIIDGEEFYHNAYLNIDSIGYQSPIKEVLQRQIDDLVEYISELEDGTRLKQYAEETLHILEWSPKENDEILLLPEEFRNKVDEMWIKFRALSSNLFR